ncbi:MAG: hypothetical protein CM1200mP41_37470 [Gammaproteobacteria bacterium]|nr:MAG: hypothetical protein CM1200mP41_37470 [Gammaproteobacteria bacterium]
MPGRNIGVFCRCPKAPGTSHGAPDQGATHSAGEGDQNICTAQVLLANIAALYAMYHGPQGLKTIASGFTDSVKFSHLSLAAFGYTVVGEGYFDTLKIYPLASPEKSRRARANHGSIFA